MHFNIKIIFNPSTAFPQFSYLLWTRFFGFQFFAECTFRTEYSVFSRTAVLSYSQRDEEGGRA
jgi:hypothetical protein